MWYAVLMNRKSRRALHAVRRKMRTVEELRTEYGNLCAQAGELQYKIKEFTGALNSLNQKIGSLNREFNSLNENAGSPQTEAQPVPEGTQDAASEAPAA